MKRVNARREIIFSHFLRSSRKFLENCPTFPSFLHCEVFHARFFFLVSRKCFSQTHMKRDTSDTFTLISGFSSLSSLQSVQTQIFLFSFHSLQIFVLFVTQLISTLLYPLFCKFMNKNKSTKCLSFSRRFFVKVCFPNRLLEVNKLKQNSLVQVYRSLSKFLFQQHQQLEGHVGS